MMEEFIHFASGTCCRYLNLALHWLTLVYMYVRIVTHPMLGWSGCVESYCMSGYGCIVKTLHFQVLKTNYIFNNCIRM